MRSESLLLSLKKMIIEDPKIFSNLFKRDLTTPITKESLKKEFFILMKPWIQSLDYEIWSVSLQKLQKSIQSSFNQRLRELTLEIIYSLLIESKRKEYQKIVAKSYPLSIDSIDYFLKKNPSFEVLKILCAHNKLQEQHFKDLWNHPRSSELMPILAANEGLPQFLIYELIKQKHSVINHTLILNNRLTLTQKLNILKANEEDTYLLLLFLEQNLWPDKTHEFWSFILKKLQDQKLKESLEVRLFFRPYEYPLDLLLRQKKFLKNKKNSQGQKPLDLDKKILLVEEKIEKIGGAKANLSKIF